MVKLIKTADNHPVTAAIGDGANDVSMIQEADVGLGKPEIKICHFEKEHIGHHMRWRLT